MDGFLRLEIGLPVVCEAHFFSWTLPGFFLGSLMTSVFFMILHTYIHTYTYPLLRSVLLCSFSAADLGWRRRRQDGWPPPFCQTCIIHNLHSSILLFREIFLGIFWRF